MVAFDFPKLARAPAALLRTLTSLWIPKKDGDGTVHALRPLSLPVTWRRLFGAAWMECVAPHIEPALEAMRIRDEDPVKFVERMAGMMRWMAD